MSGTAAKILPFDPEHVLVDAAFTTRSAQVNVCTGPVTDSVNVEVEIRMEDDLSPRVAYPVLVLNHLRVAHSSILPLPVSRSTLP